MRILSDRFVVRPLGALIRPSSGQIGSLDALRTLAILLVVSNHVSYMVKTLLGPTWLTRLPLCDGGWMGVDLFFVLSGYFIGCQLWREMQATQGIEFLRFIVRRGLRIWPLYGATFVFAALVLRRADFPFGKWWSDLVFLSNYFNAGIVAGGWSLCTEEQFYLIAPLLILWGLHRHASPATFRRALVGIALCLPVIRAVEWYSLTGSLTKHDLTASQHLYQPIHTHADGLVIGMLLAHFQIFHSDVFRWRALRSPLIIAAGFAACVSAELIARELLIFSGLALAFGSMVAVCVARGNATGFFLNSRTFHVCSRLSYGMYLNHAYLLGWLFPSIRHSLGAGGSAVALQIESFVIVTGASAACAMVTFCLIEHPFLDLREAWLRKGTA